MKTGDRGKTSFERGNAENAENQPFGLPAIFCLHGV